MSALDVPQVKKQKPLLLSELSWPELQKLLPDIRLVIQPVGSLEQHGPNTALETDTAIADEISKIASARLWPKVLVAPAIPWGFAPYHMGFPGTVTMRPETVIAVLRDVFRSLQRHGLNRWLMTNFHSGNEAMIGMAVQSLTRELEPDFLGSCSLYALEPDEIEEQIKKSEFVGHACEVETSELMYLRPDLVKIHALQPGISSGEGGSVRRRFWQRGVRVAWTFDDATYNGALGDSRHASYEAGKSMVEAILDEFDSVLIDIIEKWDAITGGSAE